MIKRLMLTDYREKIYGGQYVLTVIDAEPTQISQIATDDFDEAIKGIRDYMIGSDPPEDESDTGG